MTNYMDDPAIVLKFSCPKKYKWNIKIEKNPIVYDKDIYSMSSHQLLVKSFDYYLDLMKDKIFGEYCSVQSFLGNIYVYNIGKKYEAYRKEFQTKIKKKISTGYYQKDPTKIKEQIIAYPFEQSLMAINIYTVFKKYIRPTKNTNYLIFAKNVIFLDAVVFYNKYVNFRENNDNIIFFLYEYHYKPSEQTINYLNNNKINYNSITSETNMQWINKNLVDEKIDVAMIDIVILIQGTNNIRNTYVFQSALTGIVYSFKTLKNGGSLIINTTPFTTNTVYNFLSYISCFFKMGFIYELAEESLKITGPVIMPVMVYFIDYSGGIDMDKLEKLLSIMYELDETGGFLYHVSDPELIKKLDLQFGTKKIPKGYVTNIIDMENQELEYAKYKNYIKQKYILSIAKYTNKFLFYQNISNQKYIDELCTYYKTIAVYLAKKYELPLKEWAEDIPEQFYNKIIQNQFASMKFTIFFRLSPNKLDQKLGFYEDVQIPNYKNTLKNHELSELAYQYIDKIDYDKYKRVELVINNRYKLLNKKLQDEYGVSINNKYVSRAWIKFFELLSDLKFLDNLNKEKIKVFHICEAPGNFINAMDYYIKMHSKTQYDWTAQSLSAMMADFYDSYGFIKKTRDRWDLGPVGTGDITQTENLSYYFEKYGDYDALISDCGEAWTKASHEEHKNLTIYQLFYALIIPKIGGNFVVKIHATASNKLYLSLVYLTTVFYEKVYFFKSNTNFWSPEMYIVGINKTNMTREQKDLFVKMAIDYSKKKITYPVEHLPESFINEYNKYTYFFVEQMTQYKKFFVFLSNNFELFNENLDKIYHIIDEKNKKWIEKYYKK